MLFQENEKLYLQLKALQAKSKANEEAMFQANQRLLNELALTRSDHWLRSSHTFFLQCFICSTESESAFTFSRDQLSKSSWRVGSVLPVNCSGDLLAQIRVLQVQSRFLCHLEAADWFVRSHRCVLCAEQWVQTVGGVALPEAGKDSSRSRPTADEERERLG